MTFMDKNMIKKFIILALATLILLSLPAYAKSSQADGKDYSGYIPMDWDRDVEMTDEDISLTEALDRMIDDGDEERDSDTGDQVVSILEVSDYSPKGEVPKQYPEAMEEGLDSLKTYLKNTFPLPKNQGEFGTCWAHSVAALAEFYGIKNFGLPRTTDYSELYLASAIFRARNNIKVGNEAEDGAATFNGNDIYMIDHGANYRFAAQLLSKGYGYVKEEDMPYISTKSDARFVDGYLTTGPDGFDDAEIIHLSNMYEVDISKDNGKNIVKEAIMRNGIVGVSCRNVSTYFYTSGDYTSYFCDVAASANHAVCIVGWDDEYPVDRFNPSRMPENPGAWLIRNSWYGGDSDFYGRNGYFWMSYEDKSLQNAAYIFEVTEDADNYDNVYYYDTQIHSSTPLSSRNFPDLTWYSANIYNVPEGGNEILKEIHFETTYDTDYEVKVYTNITDPNDPMSGTALESATVSGVLSFPGIYAIPLKYPIEVKGGSSFSVVIKTTGKSVDYERSCGNGQYNVAVGVKEGQSLYRYETETKTYPWNDMKTDGRGGNFCISAHTSDVVKTSLAPKDFYFKAPSDAAYDGSAHVPSIETGLLIGEMKVFYDDGSGEWTENAPVLPGTYKVKIDVSGNEGYYPASGLTDEGWSFTIKKGSIKVKADDKSAYKGEKMPILTYSVTGYAAGDPFIESPVLSCDVSDTSEIGRFTIEVSGGKLKDPELFDKVSYANGTLTITEEGGGSGEEGGESGSGEEGGGSGEDGGGSGEKGGESGSGEEGGGSGSEEGGGGSGAEEGGNPGDPSPSEEKQKENVSFVDGAGVSVNLIYDRERNTYETSSGETVLAMSTVSGSALPNPEYEYTGKKITPGKMGFVVHDGVIYRFKNDYTISFKKNKKCGTATAVIKWKKHSIPYLEGERKTVSTFSIIPRAVTEKMVNIVLKGDGIKKISIVADGRLIKASKKDYAYSGTVYEGFEIVFMNNFSGYVSKKI